MQNPRIKDASGEFRFVGFLSSLCLERGRTRSRAHDRVSHRGISTIWLARLPERRDGRLFDGRVFTARNASVNYISRLAVVPRALDYARTACPATLRDGIFGHCYVAPAGIERMQDGGDASHRAPRTARLAPASFAFACVPRVCSEDTRQNSGAFCGCTRRVNTRVNSREKRRNCCRVARAPARPTRPRLLQARPRANSLASASRPTTNVFDNAPERQTDRSSAAS